MPLTYLDILILDDEDGEGGLLFHMASWFWSRQRGGITGALGRLLCRRVLLCFRAYFIKIYKAFLSIVYESKEGERGRALGRATDS